MSIDEQTRFSTMIAEKYNEGVEPTDLEGNAVPDTLGWCDVAAALDDIVKDPDTRWGQV